MPLMKATLWQQQVLIIPSAVSLTSFTEKHGTEFRKECSIMVIISRRRSAHIKYRGILQAGSFREYLLKSPAKTGPEIKRYRHTAFVSVLHSIPVTKLQ